MSSMKRALEAIENGGALIETSTGAEGKPVIKIGLLGGEVIIYESLHTPGVLVMEIDDYDDVFNPDVGDEAFPGVSRLPKVPGLRVYHNDNLVSDGI